jgi:WD40 repeat protein
VQAAFGDGMAPEKPRVFKGHTSAISSMAFSGDGKSLVTGSWDCTARVWAPATGKVTTVFKEHNDGWVTAVAISADGKMIASGDGDVLHPQRAGVIKIWDPVTGKEKHTLRGHSSMIYALAFSPDGSALASASGEYNRKEGIYKAGEIKVWDTGTGKERYTIHPEYPKAVSCIAFSPDGESIVAGCGGSDERRHILQFAAKTGKKQAAFVGHKGPVVSVAFSRDGKTLVSAGTDFTLRVWDVEKKEVRQTIKPHAVLFFASISPDGKMLASGSADNTVKLWSAETGKCLATFTGHTNTVSTVVFSPDGKFVASGSNDYSVRIWPVPAKKQE